MYSYMSRNQHAALGSGVPRAFSGNLMDNLDSSALGRTAAGIEFYVSVSQAWNQLQLLFDPQSPCRFK
jgi:hypothetical protein